MDGEQRKSSFSSSGLQISFNDLNYSVTVGEAKNRQERQILKNVNGVFQPGKLTVIMGASGAGKTSLLNVLANEASGGSLSGRIYVNEEEIHGDGMKRISGFVFQEDVILSTMTVYEAISMSATLRLPSTTTVEQREAKIEEMIEMLSLEKCRNTIVGSAKIKGVSGGERKRTAMAMELITEPDVLFLDEPTSGLDTFTAFAVIKILRDIAHSTNRTVIATIHQPSSEIFRMFDDLLLLADGRVIYQGTAAEATPYFEGHGYKCPPYTNPADFIFRDVLNNEDGDSAYLDASGKRVVESNRARIERLLSVWPETPQGKAMHELTHTRRPGRIQAQHMKTISSVSNQIGYLFKRAFLSSIRNPLVVRSRAIQSIVVGLFMGLLYLNNNNNPTAAVLQNKFGVLFFFAMNNVFSTTTENLSVFGEEKHVFVREHGSGYYSLEAFFTSKILAEIPFQILFPVIRVVIIYWMVGLNPDFGKFLILCAYNVLANFVGFALGVCLACGFEVLEVALIVTPMILLPLMLFSGFFVNNDSIPVFLDWIKWLSPIKYAFEGMVKNEFEGTLYGDRVIQSLGLNDGLSVVICSLILLAMTTAFVLLSYYFLWRLISGGHGGPKKSKDAVAK